MRRENRPVLMTLSDYLASRRICACCSGSAPLFRRVDDRVRIVSDGSRVARADAYCFRRQSSRKRSAESLSVVRRLAVAVEAAAAAATDTDVDFFCWRRSGWLESDRARAAGRPGGRAGGPGGQAGGRAGGRESKIAVSRGGRVARMDGLWRAGSR